MSRTKGRFIILGLVFSMVFFSFCNDQYENHALAFRNNTNDSIQVDRHYSGSIKPRTTMIAPDEYEKFFETSSDLWVSPSVEMEKSCDSVIITGLKNQEEFTIRFSPNDLVNYCSSPYSTSADWALEVIINEEPKFIGKTLERYNIHIFDINPACISTN